MPDERSWLRRWWDHLSGVAPDVHPDIPEPLVIRDIAGKAHEMPTVPHKSAAQRKKTVRKKR